MKARILELCCVLLFVCVSLSTCSDVEFLIPPIFQDVSTGSTVTATNICDDSCKNGVNETTCRTYGVCYLKCPSGSRTTFPGVTSATVKNSCSDNKKDPTTSQPQAAKTTNGNLYYNTTNGNCFVNETGDLTKKALSLWVKGACNNCSFLHIGENTKVHSLFLSQGGDLLINGIVHGHATDWLHLIIQKAPNSSLSVFVNGKLKTSLTSIAPSTKIKLGVTKSFTSGSVHILDFQVFQHLLTDREVEKVYSGNWNESFDVPECRCPVSHPTLDSTGYLCYSDAANQQNRLEKIFHDPSAITDGNRSTSWISGNEATTTLSFVLGNSYQITSIQLSFGDALPSVTTWKRSFDNKVSTDMSHFTCNQTGCQLKANVSNYPDYQKTVADKIEVVLQNSKNLIISKLVVDGRCNCNGNSDNCIKGPATNNYTCQCSVTHRKEGTHCQDCENGFYRDADEFACLHVCPGCNELGRFGNRTCSQVGGKCKCKANVEGTFCNMCKPLTYSFGSPPDGCITSKCFPNGTKSCSNVTGECNCRPNVNGKTCNSCREFHYDIKSGTGCRPCLCDSKGTVNQNMSCDIISGDCECKTNVVGKQCNQCKDKFWKLESTNDVGCKECDCNVIGSENLVCDNQTGQCPCRSNNFINIKCKPTLTDVVPKYGPQIGDTIVTVFGNLLNGSAVYYPKIYLDTKLINKVNSKSEKMITFKTNKVTSLKEVSLQLRWNSRSDLLDLGKFVYKPDPTITKDAVNEVTTFASGGCGITVKGKNLDSVYQPMVKISTGSQINEAACEVQNGNAMECPMPSLKNVAPNSSLSVNLELDGVKYNSLTNVIVIEDPQLKNNRNIDFKYPFEKTITINGARLQEACRLTDVKVMIGDGVCENIQRTDTAITCQPPADPPGNQEEFTIHVSIGFFNQSVGKLFYKKWWNTNYFIYIMTGVGAFVLLVIAILIAICCYVHRKRKRNKLNNRESTTKFTDVPQTGAELQPLGQPSVPGVDGDPKFAIDNPAYSLDTDMVIIRETFLHELEESIRSSVGECLINGDQFQVGKICSHKGQFSRVVDGSFNYNAQKNPNIKLMIKMPIEALLDEPKLPIWTSSVLRDTLRLQKHLSSNVHRIFGIGLDDKRFYLLYPFMEHRTLKDHVVKTSNNFMLSQMVEFCVDIAEGMDFLASVDIVHKDLAARNCWVDSNQTVKVGDGAFSWDLYPNEYMFDKHRKRHIPVRWMAPESLSSGFYDTKSDVWSFGVVMWEVLTRGLLPFQEIQDECVKDHIVTGYRLGKPHLICDELFKALNMCWNSETEERPSFSLLSIRFRSMLEMGSANVSGEDMYINPIARPESIYINLEQTHTNNQPVLPPKSYKKLKPDEHIYGNV